MTMSLVVPVCDDLDGVRHVVRTAYDLGIFSQIILSDDASEVALTVEAVSPDVQPLGPHPEIKILRHETRGGAGAARNLALPHITGDYVLFFDADDYLRPELSYLWQRLAPELEQGSEFDFCMFQHVESRLRDQGHVGMFPKDEALWATSGAAHVLTEMPADSVYLLAQVAAYPWNKIYRTAFLRAHNISCGETLVHNDIALHWLGFFHAKRILCSNILGCEHVMGATRNHLTKRNGSERLQLLTALHDVLDRDGGPAGEWRFAFACFSTDILVWARQQIQRQFLDEFDQQAKGFLRKQIDAGLYAQLNRHDPHLARRCLNLMVG